MVKIQKHIKILALYICHYLGEPLNLGALY
jgi:hypothetical protein